MASRYADDVLVLCVGRMLVVAAPRIALSLKEAFDVNMQVLGDTDYGSQRLLPA